jgi:predicted ATP-grasp superfamily ATP-dependent carboligase
LGGLTSSRNGMKESSLNLISRPKMKSPVMVAGLSGWPDAGGVSSLSVAYLRDTLNASLIGTIELSSFIDHTQHRPIVLIEDGVIKSIAMPGFEVFWAIAGQRDLILVKGFEPNSGWERFVAALFELVETFGVDMVVTIGGLLDRIPHTKPVRVSFLTDSREIHQRAVSLGLRPSNYQGPASIHSYIMHECGKLGLKAVSVWGHVPSYLNISNPRVIGAVLEKVGKLAGVDLDLDRLYFEASLFEGKLENMMEQDSELRRLVEALEREFDEEERRPDYIT